MPTFLPPEAFDRTRMTDDERARFDAAMTAYDAVQRSNQQWPQTMEALLPGYHRPGPKSALFHRLLSGKPALPFPPPTAFSYPWYDVVETPGPFSVMVGDDLFAPWKDNPTRLGINQCGWTRLGSNPAAQALSAFMTAPATAGLNDTQWRQAVNDLLAEDPRWTVRFDPWPVFELRMGRRRVHARRETLVPRRGELEGGHPQVLEVLQTWDEEQHANDARRQAAQNRPENERSVTEHLLLSAHRFEPPLRASDWDWVLAETDGWQIQQV